MPNKKELTIDLGRPSAPAGAIEDPRGVMSRLIADGFDEMTLVGLGRLRAKFRDGKIWDGTTLRAEEDAMFLLEAYQRLQELLRLNVACTHRVYLGDGCFEISAQISPQSGVRVRMGEYRDNDFALDEENTTSLSIEEYSSIWNTIAGALVEASSGRRGSGA